MPPAKRPSSGRSSSSSSPRSGSARTSSGSRSTGARAPRSAALGGARSAATSARKAAGGTSTQAKAGTTRTGNAAKNGAGQTARGARSTARSAASTAKTARTGAAGTGRAARAGAKGAATAATSGAKNSRSGAKAASTRTRRTGGAASVGDQLAQGLVKPRDLVMLTRTHIQEALDDAASRGRVTRKDANDLVSELVRRGRGGGNELVKEIESLLGRAGSRARGSDSVDRIVRGADRARRAAGVTPSFPISGYDDLNVSQVQSRIKELKKPERRKVLSYERKHANRKTVVSALEKSLA